MCYGAEAAWVPAVIAALGTGTSMVNQNRALRKQDEQVARGITEQARLGREAGSRVQEEIASVAGSDPRAERAESLDQYVSALRSSKSDAEGSLQSTGAVSDRFSEDLRSGAKKVAETGATRADQLSRIDAPIRQRQGEGTGFNRLAVDLRQLGDRSGSADYLSRLRANEQRPNPWVDALGGLAVGVGSGMASRGYGSGANAGKLARSGTIIDSGSRSVPWWLQDGLRMNA